jgi:hypothetical protein
VSEGASAGLQESGVGAGPIYYPKRELLVSRRRGFLFLFVVGMGREGFGMELTG